MVFNILYTLLQFMIDNWIHANIGPERSSVCLWLFNIYSVYKPLAAYIAITQLSEIERVRYDSDDDVLTTTSSSCKVAKSIISMSTNGEGASCCCKPTCQSRNGENTCLVHSVASDATRTTTTTMTTTNRRESTILDIANPSTTTTFTSFTGAILTSSMLQARLGILQSFISKSLSDSQLCMMIPPASSCAGAASEAEADVDVDEDDDEDFDEDDTEDYEEEDSDQEESKELEDEDNNGGDEEEACDGRDNVGFGEIISGDVDVGLRPHS
jgi:hypothetical protein